MFNIYIYIYIHITYGHCNWSYMFNIRMYRLCNVYVCNMYYVYIQIYYWLVTDPVIHCCLLNPSPFAGRSRTMASPELGLFFLVWESAAKCHDLRVLVPIHSFKLTARLPLKSGAWETTGRIDSFRQGREICFPLREPFPVFRRNGADGVFWCFLLISMTIPILPKKSSFPFSPLMVNVNMDANLRPEFPARVVA